MKRLLILIALLFPVRLYANQSVSGWCELGNQTVTIGGLSSNTKIQKSFPSCTVTVYLTGTVTAATLYSNNLSTPTPLANPFTANSNGSWRFYAGDGRYDVVLSGGGIPSPYTLTDILLSDTRYLTSFGAVCNGSTNDAAALTTASTTLAVTGGSLVIPAGRTCVIATNTSISATVPIQFEPGAKFSASTGVTVTIAGEISPMLRKQYFAGLGTFSFAGNTKILAFYPEWWGTVHDGVTDDSVPLQATIDAAITGTRKVELAPGKYYIGTTTINITATGFQLEGHQEFIAFATGMATPIGSSIKYGGTGTALKIDNPDGAYQSGLIYRVKLDHFNVTASTASASKGIEIVGAEEVHMESVQVGISTYDETLYGFVDGIYLNGVNISTIHNPLVTHCTNGINFISSTSVKVYSGNLFKNTYPVKMATALNIQFFGTWMEWFQDAVAINNDNPADAASVQGVTFKGCRFLNGGGASNPFVNNIRVLHVTRTATTKTVSVFGLKFDNCLVTIYTPTGTIAAAPFTLTSGGAGGSWSILSLLVRDSVVAGGSTAGIATDDVSGYAISEDNYWSADTFTGGVLPAFTGAGTSRSEWKQTATQRELVGNLLVTGNVQITGTITGVPAYTLPFYGPAFSPADSTSYYIGSLYTFANATSGGSRRVFIPKSGIIRAVYVTFLQTTLAGTGEDSTVSIRLNNTTDTVISTVVDNDATDEVFSNVALSIAVVRGDFIEIKWTTPAWVTNPTGVIISGNVYIE